MFSQCVSTIWLHITNIYNVVDAEVVYVTVLIFILIVQVKCFVLKHLYCWPFWDSFDDEEDLASLKSQLIVVPDTTSSLLASSLNGHHAAAWTSNRSNARLCECHVSCALRFVCVYSCYPPSWCSHHCLEHITAPAPAPSLVSAMNHVCLGLPAVPSIVKPTAHHLTFRSVMYWN